MGIILSAWTVVVFFLFIGICAWAWSNKNKESFESAAHIPFDDDDVDETIQRKEDISNG